MEVYTDSVLLHLVIYCDTDSWDNELFWAAYGSWHFGHKLYATNGKAVRWPNASLDDNRAHHIDAVRYGQVTLGETVDENFADPLLLSNSTHSRNRLFVLGLHYLLYRDKRVSRCWLRWYFKSHLLLLPLYVHTYGFGQPSFYLLNQSQKQ